MTSSTLPARFRRLTFGIATLMVTTLSCLLVLELGLRLFWDGYYVRGPRNYIEYHPTRGWATRPNVSVTYGKPEFANVFTHNSMGFRGPEIDPLERQGRIRILALGDSMTYGFGVENDETYSALLEQLDPRLQVLNTGVAGYSTAEELLMLKEQGLALDPDIVLLGFFWNDVPGVLDSFSRFTLEPEGVRIEPPPDGSPEHRALRARRGKHPWRGKSYAYRFLSDRLKILRYVMRERLGLAKGEELELMPAQVEPAWVLIEGLIREIVRLSRKQGASTVLVVIADQGQVDRSVQLVGVTRSAMDAARERLLGFARHEGIPVIDLLPPLRAAFERDGRPLYYHFDRHWNAEGHRQAADAILAGLVRLGLVQRPGVADREAAAR